jgi:hypothetical protein
VIVFSMLVSASSQYNIVAVPAEGDCAECTVLAMAKATPALHNEIVAAFAALGRAMPAAPERDDDVSCAGHMLGRSWKQLDGAHVPPFYCAVAGRKLLVDAPTTYRDAEDRDIVWGSDGWRDRAARAVIRKPRWKWGDDVWRD